MFTHVSPADFDYLTVYDTVWGLDLRYDPELARAQIREAMIETGAELVDGVWHYNGQPVRLKFIIRVEDERRTLGDLVRAELAAAGLRMEPIYQPFAPAVQAVYASDPAQMGWHLYTEGWGRGAPQRYDFGTINQMSAPWLGNLPGWREVGFWQYEHGRLDELGKRLFRGEFKNRLERDEIYREMTRLGLEESVRIWVATVMSAFPAGAGLQGITEDLAAGPRGIWSLREAHVPGRDDLTVGHAWVWTERTTWNPIGGFGDVYSVDIWRNLHDPPLWNHPFTGIPGSFRAGYEVKTAGPDGKVAVPADAVLWDVNRKAWRPVGEGASATSKVTFDYGRYFQAPWHHGRPISMADVIYSIYQSFDMAYDPNKARIEIAMAVTARPYLETFRGFRVLDDRRLEVYVDFWHFEPDYIASYASPAGLSMPWEVLHAMDVLVFEQRRAAFSDTAAARFNVPWLSLVLDRDARLVRRVLLDLRDRAAFPREVFSLPEGQEPAGLVDAATAVARYQAVLDWFDRYGHLVISNGPFILARYDPPAQFAELHAFRDPAYPFQAGDHYKGRPQLIEFTRAEAGELVPGQEFEVKVSLSGPGELAVRYLLLDTATGEVVHQGQAMPVAEADFAVRLDADATAGLEVGLYQFLLAAYSDQLAQITEQRLVLEAGLPRPEAPVETPVAEAPAVAEETPTVEPTTTPLPAVVPAPPPAAPGTPVGVIVGVVAVIVVLGAGAVLWWSRQRRKRE
jgi:peptide/nickel transport system substrate-binding protein